ncbi:Hypothetical predicted protein [Olea europaea subsp. europaea]|uniref:Uncharacterized protein n=1 Tax=Olea europaea subsp. europaea TaxID=158383 RepID=A0A8S0SSL2_OLEEU|nr:Hypothetical predicted protein [Olea europaea subsp. europaea]
MTSKFVLLEVAVTVGVEVVVEVEEQGVVLVSEKDLVVGLEVVLKEEEEEEEEVLVAVVEADWVEVLVVDSDLVQDTVVG